MKRAPALALLTSRIVSPTGELVLVFDDEHCLRAVDWTDYATRMADLLRRHYGDPGVGYTLASTGCPAGFASAFEAYFEGRLDALDGLAVRTNGTDFQRAVWSALRTIPPGRPTSYGALAADIGKPAAVRAVGLANGANPLAIVVPCHRVIGANGTLTGYGGGLERKAWLLAHEGMSFDLPAHARSVGATSPGRPA
jgi:methylated-DNA-[protein]-cysteine S-methyltransferase